MKVWVHNMKISYISKIIEQSIQEFMIYRKTAIITFLLGLLFLGMEVVAGIVYYAHTTDIYGWSQNDYFLLIATANTISFLYQMCFINGHEYLADTVIEGNLDYELLRPMNSLFIVVFRRIDIASFMNFCISFIMQIYFLRIYKTNLYILFIFGVLNVLAVWIYFCINQILLSFVFWKEKIDAFMGVPEYLFDFSMRPISIYPTPIGFLFGRIVPIILAINAPVLFLKREFHINYFLVLVSFTIVSMIIIRIIWKKGLERYTSAN